jgi:hypothetical protein
MALATQLDKQQIIEVKNVANDLAEMIRQQRNLDALDKYYSDNIKSYEAEARDSNVQLTEGLQAVKKKNEAWFDAFDVQEQMVDEPYINGNQFALKMSADVIDKDSEEKISMSEIGLYTVDNGKITEETFYYGYQQKL